MLWRIGVYHKFLNPVKIKERNRRFLEQTERLNKVQETIKVNKFVKNVISGFDCN